MAWNPLAFRDRFPTEYESKGNKFITDLRHNNQEIYQKIIAESFASIIPFAIDTSCISRYYDATNLALAAEELTGFMDSNKIFDQGMIQMKNDFTLAQQKKAALLFIQQLQATSDVINIWEQFRNQQAAPQNHYEQEIDNLEHKFNLESKRCAICVRCQITCQLI